MPLLPAVVVVRLREEEARVLPLRAGGGLDGDRVHAGDPREHVLELVEEPQGTLHRRLVLVRMDARDGREGREFFRELRVELHRARAERVEARVDPEVHLREPREMPHDLVFGEVRNPETVPAELRRHQVREVDRLVRRGSLLEEERLVPIGLAEAHATASRARSRRFTSSAF